MALVEQTGAASVALEPERASRLWVPGMGVWRLASIALFCGLWEIAGRIPINPAFPPFSDTLFAFLPVIVLNSYKAVRNVNPSLIAMCRSFLGTPRQQIMQIVLPDAAPLIFAGLRLGVSAGFIGVILAELLITPTGIGDLITFHRSTASYPEMYASIASIVIFSALTLAVLQWVEIRLFRPEKRAR